MKKIIYFTKYTKVGPSSRYRTFQYLKYINDEFKTEVYPLFDDSYLNNLYQGKRINLFRIFSYYFKRIHIVIQNLNKNNIFYIEYELLPYFPPLIEFILKVFRIKYILDYDDAIFHNYDKNNNFIIRFFFKNKIKKIAKKASYIITGSEYLSTYFKQINKNVIEIPTSISIDFYSKKHIKNSKHNNIVIGWIGSKTTSKNLIKIKESIEYISRNYSNVTFNFCGFEESLLSYFKNSNIKLTKWSEENEFKFLNQIDIGIMPLENNYFNNGKCGFKLIQYMAMKKPTISTPLLTNKNINKNNKNLHANENSEWIEKIETFLENPNFYTKVGEENFDIIKKYYSIESNYEKYIKLFKSI